MEDMTRRSLVIRDGIHSAEIKGSHITDANRRDAQDYIDDLIDADALVNSTRVRFGLEQASTL